MSQSADEATSLEQLAIRLGARFPDSAPDKVRTLVTQVHQQYDGSRIRDFVPVLVEREVADALRAERRLPRQETATP